MDPQHKNRTNEKCLFWLLLLGITCFSPSRPVNVSMRFAGEGGIAAGYCISPSLLSHA